jgi:hypothetical protein
MNQFGFRVKITKEIEERAHGWKTTKINVKERQLIQKTIMIFEVITPA